MARRAEKRYTRRHSEKEYRKFKVLTLTAIALILMLTAGTLLYRTYQLKREEESYKKQVEQLEVDIEKESERYEELKQRRMDVASDNFIESEARKRLNYIYDGEVLIKSR